MRIVNSCSCALDVHKKTVVANLVRAGVEGAADLDEVRTFGTMTADLLKSRIPVKKATRSGNKKPPGEWSDPVTASIAGWLF